MLTVVRRNLLRPSGLAYPAGTKPGFDPSHIASAGVSLGHGFSGVAQNANFLSLLSGSVGSITNAPTASMYGTIGPAFTTPGSGQSHSTTFAGQSTAIDFTGTIAVIFQITSLNAATSCLFLSSSNVGTSNGMWLLYNSTANLAFNGPGSGGANSAITISAGVPYFVAGSRSGNAGTTNVLAMRLDNGVILTDTPASGTLPSNAPNGSYMVGNGGVNRSLNGGVAAVMFSKSFMSMQQLQQWAKNPWKFWYPGVSD
jgi:hypothetical protein